nr:MAG TPA: Transcription initiation factor IIE, alpha FINGER, Transcription [Caudoviricetes sp.]
MERAETMMRYIYCNECGKIIGFADFEKWTEIGLEYYLCPECATKMKQAAAIEACKKE